MPKTPKGNQVSGRHFEKYVLNVLVLNANGRFLSILLHLFGVGVREWVSIAKACKWGSECIFWELTVFFHHVGSDD